MKQTKPKPVAQWPWDPVNLTIAEISAIKAMANTHPIAFEVVCVKLCRERYLSFTVGPGPDGPRATDFAEGKRAVASNLRTIVAMKMPGARPRPGPHDPHAIPTGPPPTD